MKGTYAACILGVAHTLAGPAFAQDQEHRFDITPLIGWRGGGDFDRDPGQNPNIAPAESFGLALGYATDDSTRYELLYMLQQSNIEDTDGFDLDVEHLHLGGTAAFNAGDLLVPFVSGGIGATRFSPETGEDEARLSIALGLGTTAPLSDRVNLRFEVRGYLVSMDHDADLFCTSVPSGQHCLVRAAGSTLFQYELLAGLALSF